MRENNFNLLRIFFAFTVLVSHIFKVSNVEAFRWHTSHFNAYFPLVGFFFISGFLITASYLRSKSVGSYLKKRLKRIYPSYLLAIFLYVFGLAFISDYSFSEYFTSPQLFRYLAANLTFFNFIEPCLPGVFTSDSMVNCAVNGSLWTIKIEVAFYLVLPVVLYFVKKVKRKYILLIALYALSIVYRQFFDHLSQITDTPLFLILSRQLPGFFSYFACGIGFYYYFDFFSKYKVRFFIVSLILFILERFMGLEILTPFAFSFMVFAAAYSFKGLGKWAKKNDISYGIYLFHYPMIKLAVFFGFFERYNPYLVALGIIFVVVVLGFLLLNVFEKRILKR